MGRYSAAKHLLGGTADISRRTFRNMDQFRSLSRIDFARSNSDAREALTRARSSLATSNELANTSNITRLRDTFNIDAADLDVYENIIKGKSEIVDDLFRQADEASAAGNTERATELVDKAGDMQRSIDDISDRLDHMVENFDKDQVKALLKKMSFY